MAGLTYHFDVEFDQCPVNDWIGMSGINLSVEKEPRKEGGNPHYSRFITKQVTYTDVTMTRYCDGKSGKLIKWVAKHINSIIPSTAKVTLLTPAKKEIYTWEFSNAVPVSYKGPDFSVDSGKPATESITFAHHGFSPTLQGAVIGAVTKAIGI